VCIARGSVPADILLIGDAPGPSEDIIGRPFIGPAGKLLDAIVGQVFDGQFDLCFTNLVGCMPINEDSGTKFTEPSKECIKACNPRLIELIRLVKPKAVVLVGKVAKQSIIGQADFADLPEGNCSWLRKNEYIWFADIIHPAVILRMDLSQQSLAIRRCVASLEDLTAHL